MGAFKLDFSRSWRARRTGPTGKYIEVTAITPNLWERARAPPRAVLREWRMRKVKVGCCLRQLLRAHHECQGTSAGGGNSLLIPMTEFPWVDR